MNQVQRFSDGDTNFLLPNPPSLFLQAANWVPTEESARAHNPRKSRTGRRKSADTSGGGGGGVAGDTQEICSTLEVVRPSRGNRINYRAVDQQ